MRRPEPSPKLDFRALCYLFLVLLALGMLLAFCSVEPTKLYAADPFVVAVRNFGKPMEPVASAFTNDPERIVLSKNFYSTQPGARQTRNGVVAAFNYNSLDTHNVDAIATLEPANDSAAIVFMAGGRWWWTFYGVRAAGEMQYVSSLATPREIKPYTPYQISNTDSTLFIQGAGAPYFTRHLLPGDTLFLSGPTDTCVVTYVLSDEFLRIDTLNGIGQHVADDWDARRIYTGADPWLYPSGKYLYTGSVKDPPQVIYNKDDTLFIRPLIMVDSFHLDAIRSVYKDSLNGSQIRQSYEQSGSDSAIVEVQLVSRRANWLRDQWLFDGTETPLTYFVSLGVRVDNNRDDGRFFPIRGNTDTSIYIANWFRSTNVSPNGISGANWDSLHIKWADTIQPTEFSPYSNWAYIYTAVGAYDVVLPDASTPKATIFGRGAVWKVTDPLPSIIDTAMLSNSLCYIHTTSDDISYSGYTLKGGRIGTYTVARWIHDPCKYYVDQVEQPLTQSQLPDTEKIISYVQDGHNKDQDGLHGALCTAIRGIWTISVSSPKRSVEADFVNSGYYPIRFARRFADTLYFITSGVNLDMLADTTRDTSSNWEIVKVGMPSWGGMASWGNPPRLVAWGDTSSPSMISMAQVNDPWNWVATGDVNVGTNVNDLVVGVLGFDDQLLVFKRNSIIGFDGSRLSEISHGDGLIARDALTSNNKQAFWLDVDGPKTIARRDFSGYTIQKIGAMLDPVWNTWSAGYWGTSVVPFYMNPAYRDQAVMEYNEYDDHLYLWFAADSSATNNRCLTYSVGRGEWDGLFTNGASAAMPMTWKDTSCLMYARNDTSMVMRTSLNWNDNGVGITSELKSGRFWSSDATGWPVQATLQRVRFTGRGSDLLFDTLRLCVYTNNSVGGAITGSVGDSITIDMSNSVADGQFSWYPNALMTGTYWEWKIYVDGGTTGTLFAPYELLFEFMPVAREK